MKDKKMLRFTLVGSDNIEHTIEGFRPLCTRRGIDDERNSIIMIQIEDQWEPWETDCMFGQTIDQRRQTMRDLLNFFTDCAYTEPHLLVRWFITDIVPRIGQNPSHRANAEVWQ
jgi:hypothetical protein